MISWRPGLAFVLLTLLPIAVLAQAPTKPSHDSPHVLSPPAHPSRTPPPARPAKIARKHGHAGPTVARPKPKPGDKHETAAAKPAKPAPPPIDPNKGTVTGLAIPRFASLRADEVNMRAGPGDRYPIEWLYKRRGMPVEIEREFEVWRLVAAPDGVKGWMHEATLEGRRDFIVTGTEQTLRAGPTETARAVAVLKPGVVGRIRSCAAGAAWCKVAVGDYRGWLPRDAFWGALPNEVIASG
ncbi:MAG: SH3 domain-containing protein [Acetobacteraceae bacterium]